MPLHFIILIKEFYIRLAILWSDMVAWWSSYWWYLGRNLTWKVKEHNETWTPQQGRPEHEIGVSRKQQQPHWARHHQHQHSHELWVFIIGFLQFFYPRCTSKNFSWTIHNFVWTKTRKRKKRNLLNNWMIKILLISVPPLSVLIFCTHPGPFSTDTTYTFHCHSHGARPSATISWFDYLGNRISAASSEVNWNWTIWKSGD